MEQWSTPDLDPNSLTVIQTNGPDLDSNMFDTGMDQCY